MIDEIVDASVDDCAIDSAIVAIGAIDATVDESVDAMDRNRRGLMQSMQ